MNGVALRNTKNSIRIRIEVVIAKTKKNGEKYAIELKTWSSYQVSEKWKQQKYLMEKAFATYNTLFMKLTALRNTREKKN